MSDWDYFCVTEFQLLIENEAEMMAICDDDDTDTEGNTNNEEL